MALDPTLVRRFTDTISGAKSAYQTPGGPANDSIVVRIGQVQSVDTTNHVALCTIAGGSVNVPVGIVDGLYPGVNAFVAVLIWGTSYLLIGTVDGSVLSVASPLSNPTGGTVNTSQTTSSTSYGDLATTGPSATVITGSNALVTISTQGSTTSTADGANMSFAISGSTVVAANDNQSVSITSTTNTTGSETFPVTGLTPGSNTFTAKYRAVTGGTATFLRRNIVVYPLP